MVATKRASYGKLSVTIILSFVLLLGYMALIDSDLYNRYAFIYSLPKEVVSVYSYDNTRHQALIKQVENRIPDTQVVSVFSFETVLNQYSMFSQDSQQVSHPVATCIFLPSGISTFYYYENTIADTPYSRPLKMLSGRDGFLLAEDEVIINQSFYQALLQNSEDTPTELYLTITWNDEITVSQWKLKIVGVCEDRVHDVFQNNHNDGWFGLVSIYASKSLLKDINEKMFPSTRYMSTIISNSPEKVISFSNALEQTSEGVVLAQKEANQLVKTELRSKGFTAVVMLILLSINLYSSFSNVLQTRSYEIGIRRALGASKNNILKQFLYESLLVLGIDTAISIIVVIDGMILYKTFLLWKSGVEWTIHISDSSWLIYGICTLALVVSFSLIFGYKATTVEIISYLKGE